MREGLSFPPPDGVALQRMRDVPLDTVRVDAVTSTPMSIPIPDRNILLRMRTGDDAFNHEGLGVQRNNMVARASEYLALSAGEGSLIDESKITEQAERLADMCASLGEAKAREFLAHPYVRNNVEYCLGLDPRKIDLALGVVDMVQEQAQMHNYDPQFAASLQLASFITLEMLRDRGLAWGIGKGAGTARNARDSLQQALQGGFIAKWGERSLFRHAVDWLQQVPSRLQGHDMEKALVAVICKDLHRKLEDQTEAMSWTGQSQGVEVEVLKYITKSESAENRGVDTKWLPRGVPKAAHTRTDWNILPILGVNEDVGERPHQRYEMATDPSAAMANQTTLLFSFMAGKFVTEEMLSDERVDNNRRGKEGYSLHVSTVFPKGILTEDSLQEYTSMARALSGAFATDQRISFGGFMSGGAEISDKSSSGNLREIGKKKDSHSKAPEGMALVEVRNLDLSIKDQYSALLHKEVLDFAFRCSWERIVHPEAPQGPLETFAAASWGRFMQDVNDLYARHGISIDSLKQKYQDDWEKWAWKDMADARERNPQLRGEFASLIRRHTGEIRGVKQELDRQSGRQRGNVDIEEIKRRTRLGNIRYLGIEPHGVGDDRIYLAKSLRDRLGINAGDNISLRLGDRIISVRGEKSRKRDDGSIEGAEDLRLRVSQNVLDRLGVPKGHAAIPVYDKKNREIRFEKIETGDAPIVKIRQPRTIVAESEGEGNSLYLSLVDQDQFGVKGGQEIVFRVGRFQKKIVVRDQPTGSSDSQQWRFSGGLIKELGIPQGIQLRGRFDRATGEFSLGSTVAYFDSMDAKPDGSFVPKQDLYFRLSARQAKDHGVFACVIDPRSQDPVVVQQGFVDAFVFDGTAYRQVRIPLPDVLYDKMPTTPEGHQLARLFEHSIIPRQEQMVAGDKWRFAATLKKSGLEAYHPDTTLVNFSSPQDLAIFLDKHKEVILKPRKGSQGRGIVRVSQEGDRYRIKFFDNTGEVVRSAQNAEEIVMAIQDIEQVKEGLEYIAQERIVMPRYKYKDPLTNEDIEGMPETRVVVQRAIDGNLHVGGVVTRLMNPKFSGLPHTKDPLVVFQALFGERAQTLLDDMKNLSIRTTEAVEETIKNRCGELSVDIAIRADGRPVILEVNSKGATRMLFKDSGSKDGEYAATAGPIEYALALTDMN